MLQLVAIITSVGTNYSNVEGWRVKKNLRDNCRLQKPKTLANHIRLVAIGRNKNLTYWLIAMLGY